MHTHVFICTHTHMHTHTHAHTHTHTHTCTPDLRPRLIRILIMPLVIGMDRYNHILPLG